MLGHSGGVPGGALKNTTLLGVGFALHAGGVCSRYLLQNVRGGRGWPGYILCFFCFFVFCFPIGVLQGAMSVPVNAVSRLILTIRAT